MPMHEYEVLFGDHHEPSEKGISVYEKGDTFVSDKPMDKLFVGKFKKTSAKVRPMMSASAEHYNEGDPVLGTFDKRPPREERKLDRPRPKRPVQSEDVDPEEDDRKDAKEKSREFETPSKVRAAKKTAAAAKPKAARNEEEDEDEIPEDEDLSEEEDEEEESEEEDDEESEDEDEDEEEESSGKDVTASFKGAKEANLKVVKSKDGFAVMDGKKPANRKALKTPAQVKAFLKDYAAKK